MTSSKNVDANLTQKVLSDALIDKLATSVLPTTPAPNVAARIKQKLMKRVDQSLANQHFIFADEGEWKNIAPGIALKLLCKNPTGKSFLIKMAPNSTLPTHTHDQDEECIVLEGEVVLDGTVCRTGDYHLAELGTTHQNIHSKQGCLMFVRGA